MRTHTPENFSFKRAVRTYERRLIERALRDADGAVTKAARLLGFNHHQNLISIINSRHRELLGLRRPIRKRYRHLIDHSKVKRRKGYRAEGSQQEAGAETGQHAEAARGDA